MFNPFRNRASVQHLREQVSHLQEVVDVLTYRSDATEASRFKGNQYPNFESQVREISRKYEGTADWGCQIARNMIDVRASFTIGSGLQVKARREENSAKREIAWCNEFIEHNNLDEEIPQDWAREAEIEGKFLARLISNPDVQPLGKFPRGMVEVRYIPWTAHGYEIDTQSDDYATYTKARYKVNGQGEEVALDPANFVFKRFGGRTHMVNKVGPRLGAVLKQMEDLDRAMADWRRMNNLFASPTPWLNCEDANAVSQLSSALQKINWKIGKLLLTAGVKEFKLAGLDSAGKDSLKQEIENIIKILSGCSGIPVHFFGYADLMSNRATAENLLELVQASTSKERRIWVGAYEELFRKAMEIANTEFNLGLDPQAITVDIPLISSAKLNELKDVWLPLYMGNTISLPTLLSKIPEINPEEELKAIEAEREEMLTQMEMESATAIDEDEDDEDDPKAKKKPQRGAARRQAA